MLLVVELGHGVADLACCFAWQVQDVEVARRGASVCRKLGDGTSPCLRDIDELVQLRQEPAIRIP